LVLPARHQLAVQLIPEAFARHLAVVYASLETFAGDLGTTLMALDLRLVCPDLHLSVALGTRDELRCRLLVLASARALVHHETDLPVKEARSRRVHVHDTLAAAAKILT
jgi:hypothetical protein